MSKPRLALKLRPDYAQAHNNLADAYIGSGLIDKAIEHFQAAAKIDPSNRLFRDDLTRAYELKNSARNIGRKTGT